MGEQFVLPRGGVGTKDTVEVIAHPQDKFNLSVILLYSLTIIKAFPEAQKHSIWRQAFPVETSFHHIWVWVTIMTGLLDCFSALKFF